MILLPERPIIDTSGKAVKTWGGIEKHDVQPTWSQAFIYSVFDCPDSGVGSPAYRFQSGRA